MGKLIWKVEIYNAKRQEWKTIAELEFNYYSSKALMDYIRNKRPDIYKKIKEGTIWNVSVKSWE